MENKMKNKMEKISRKRKLKCDIKNPNMVKIINKRLENEISKKGLWKTKDQITDKKYNEYCKKYNEINTYGGWKNKVYGVAKSNIQRRIEKGELSPKWNENKKRKIKIKTKEAAILYDKENGDCDVYKAEIEKINGEIIVKIPYGNKKKLKVKVHKEIINDKEIIEAALENGAEIYTIDEIL